MKPRLSGWVRPADPVLCHRVCGCSLPYQNLYPHLNPAENGGESGPLRVNPLKIETKISGKRFDGEITLKHHDDGQENKITLLKGSARCRWRPLLEERDREWFCVAFRNVT